MNEALRCRPEWCLIRDKRHVLLVRGNVLTLSNPQVMIHETKGAELSLIIFLEELQLHRLLGGFLVNHVCLWGRFKLLQVEHFVLLSVLIHYLNIVA